MLKSLPIIAGVILLAAATSAHAQAGACKTKVFVDAVYGHQTGAGKFEYILQLRNLTRKPVAWQVNFKNMPSGMTMYKDQMESGTTPLAPGGTTSLRIGTGTNANVSANSVSIGYDTPGSAVTVTHCK